MMDGYIIRLEKTEEKQKNIKSGINEIVKGRHKPVEQKR